MLHNRAPSQIAALFGEPSFQDGTRSFELVYFDLLHIADVFTLGHLGSHTICFSQRCHGTLRGLDSGTAIIQGSSRYAPRRSTIAEQRHGGCFRAGEQALWSTYITDLVIVCPEDLGGHSLHGPSWSLAEFRAWRAWVMCGEELFFVLGHRSRTKTSTGRPLLTQVCTMYYLMADHVQFRSRTCYTTTVRFRFLLL